MSKTNHGDWDCSCARGSCMHDGSWLMTRKDCFLFLAYNNCSQRMWSIQWFPLLFVYLYKNILETGKRQKALEDGIAIGCVKLYPLGAVGREFHQHSNFQNRVRVVRLQRQCPVLSLLPKSFLLWFILIFFLKGNAPVTTSVCPYACGGEPWRRPKWPKRNAPLCFCHPFFTNETNSIAKLASFFFFSAGTVFFSHRKPV